MLYSESRQEILRNLSKNSVFRVFAPLFHCDPVRSWLCLDAELNFPPNSSSLRNNSCCIANPDRKYLEICPKNQCFMYLTYFPLWTFSKLVVLDAELNSAPNRSSFRNNPSFLANPNRKYLDICPKTQCFEYVTYFFVAIPVDTGWVGCRIKFCT